MRVARFTFAAMLLILCADRAAAQSTVNASPQSTPAPTLLQSRQTEFAIPFSIDPAAEPLVEVQLLTSTDQGATWRVYARENPAAGRFAFRAPGDGQYWFSIRTIDRSGRAQPPGRPAAELRVIIDTTPPNLDFTANAGPAGEVTTAWRVFDANLQVESLTIEYQEAVGQPWQRVAVDVPRDGLTRTTVAGEVTWWPRTASESINVRGQVRDTAGNVTPVTRRIVLRRVANEPAPSAGRDTAAGPPVDPFLTHRRSPRGGGPIPWPVDRQTYDLPGRENAAADTRFPPPPEMASPPGTDRFIAHTPRGNDRVDLPHGVRPRWTRQRRFQLSYGIDEASSQGVANVELWITKDGTRSWQLHGSDADLQSPLDVEVDGEGTYGFRIVIASRNGLLTPLPQSGDSAEMWVVVDQTEPTARITSAIYGSGPHAGELDIRWHTEDANPTSRGVTLLCGQRPTGPWTTVVSGLPQTGQYYWRHEGSVAGHVYLAVSAVDAAGNEGGHQLSEPIRLGGLAPRGRILDLLPAGDSHR